MANNLIDFIDFSVAGQIDFTEPLEVEEPKAKAPDPIVPDFSGQMEVKSARAVREAEESNQRGAIEDGWYGAAQQLIRMYAAHKKSMADQQRLLEGEFLPNSMRWPSDFVKAPPRELLDAAPRETSHVADKLAAESRELWKLSNDPAFDPTTEGTFAKFVTLGMSTVPYITGTTLATITTGPLGGFAVGYMVEGNSAYNAAIDHFEKTNEDGVVTDEQMRQAELVGFAVGILSGTIETVGGRYFDKLSSGAGKALQKKLFDTAAKESLARVVAKKVIVEGAEFTLGNAGEALEEWSQEMTQLGFAEIYRDVNWREEFGQTVEAAIGGFVVGGMGHTVRSAANRASQIGKPKVQSPAEQVAEVLNEADGQTQESVLTDLDEESLGELQPLANQQLTEKIDAEIALRKAAQDRATQFQESDTVSSDIETQTLTESGVTDEIIESEIDSKPLKSEEPTQSPLESKTEEPAGATAAESPRPPDVQLPKATPKSVGRSLAATKDLTPEMLADKIKSVATPLEGTDRTRLTIDQAALTEVAVEFARANPDVAFDMGDQLRQAEGVTLDIEGVTNEDVATLLETAAVEYVDEAAPIETLPASEKSSAEVTQQKFIEAMDDGRTDVAGVQAAKQVVQMAKRDKVNLAFRIHKGRNVLDPTNPSHRRAILDAGFTEKDIEDAKKIKAQAKKVGKDAGDFIVAGKESVAYFDDGTTGSIIEIWDGHSAEDIFHEYVHARQRQAGTLGKAEQRQLEIEAQRLGRKLAKGQTDQVDIQPVSDAAQDEAGNLSVRLRNVSQEDREAFVKTLGKKDRALYRRIEYLVLLGEGTPWKRVGGAWKGTYTNATTAYMNMHDWNDHVKEFPAFGRMVADAIPKSIRTDPRMMMDSTGKLGLGYLDEKFVMDRSIVQRILDALPPELIPGEISVDGRKVNLGTKSVLAPGGVSLRNRLIEEYRRLRRKGKLPRYAVAKLSQKDWGAFGWLSINDKTFASADNTTLCPNLFYAGGCLYCYRTSTLKSGNNNKGVAQTVWYAGELLRMTDKDIKRVNASGGLRIQSFGDFLDSDKPQLAHILADADTMGINVKFITKEAGLVHFLAHLKKQGIGKNAMVDISTDDFVEEAPKIAKGDKYAAWKQPKPFRPFARIDGKFYWKRALSRDEGRKLVMKYPWVKMRTVALTVKQFLAHLADPDVMVVTGYHGIISTPPLSLIDIVSGQEIIQLEAVGNGGMPRFDADGKINKKWLAKRTKDAMEGKGRVQKTALAHIELAKGIEKLGLQVEYAAKACCVSAKHPEITEKKKVKGKVKETFVSGQCDDCTARCGANKLLSLNNWMPGDDHQSGQEIKANKKMIAKARRASMANKRNSILLVAADEHTGIEGSVDLGDIKRLMSQDEPVQHSIKLTGREELETTRESEDNHKRVADAIGSGGVATARQDVLRATLLERTGQVGPRSSDSESFDQWLDTAYEKGVHRQARQIASEVIARPRSLSPVESAGLVIRLNEIMEDHTAALVRYDTASDPAEVASAAVEVQRLEDEHLELATAMDYSGSERGRALVSQKLAIADNYDLLHLTSRAAIFKGEKLSADEKRFFKEKTKALKDAQKKIEQLEKKLAATKAEQHFSRNITAKALSRMTTQERNQSEARLVQRLSDLMECNR